MRVCMHLKQTIWRQVRGGAGACGAARLQRARCLELSARVAFIRFAAKTYDGEARASRRRQARSGTLSPAGAGELQLSDESVQ